MRAAPPLAFTVSRYGAWRAALGALGVAAGVVTLAWWQAGGAAAAAWVPAGLACALLPVVEACRLRPQTLRWDGALWHVGPVAEGAHGMSRAGRLHVVADLGPWLLLRFTAEAAFPAVPRRLPRGGDWAWIALQRRGLEDLWHAIRCTVYSPPPAGPPRGAPVRPSE